MERIANNANFQTLLVQKTAGLITTQEMADLLNIPFSTLYSFLKKMDKNINLK
jgi:predicted transcriptional regulator